MTHNKIFFTVLVVIFGMQQLVIPHFITLDHSQYTIFVYSSDQNCTYNATLAHNNTELLRETYKAYLSNCRKINYMIDWDFNGYVEDNNGIYILIFANLIVIIGMMIICKKDELHYHNIPIYFAILLCAICFTINVCSTKTFAYKNNFVFGPNYELEGMIYMDPNNHSHERIFINQFDMLNKIYYANIITNTNVQIKLTHMNAINNYDLNNILILICVLLSVIMTMINWFIVWYQNRSIIPDTDPNADETIIQINPYEE